jgi:hypothetical protein
MTTSDRRPGLLGRLFGASPPPPASPPPLFQPRPVPKLPPKGPGLPDWGDILSAAPAVLEPPPGEMPGMAPPAHLTPLAASPAADGTVPGWPAKRPPTEAETHILAEVAALLAAGRIAQAAAALDAGLADRPEVADTLGRPVWLLESLHLALLLNAADAAEDHARRLRPHLQPDDPVIEVLYARAAAAAGNRAAARSNWAAALARRPDLAEALAWLAAHPASPEGGVLARDLLGATAFAGKILQPPMPNHAPAEPVTLADWLPARLLTGAVLSVGEDGSPAATPDGPAAGTAADAASADLALLFRHPDGLEQPRAFAEVLLAAFVLQRQFLGHLRPVRLYVGRQPWARAPAAVTVHAAMLAALFPGLRVIGEHDGAIREAHVLVVDGGARNAATGTLIGGMMPWVLQWTQDARARAHAACGLPDSAEPPRVPGRRPRVLYLHAAPPCALADPVRDRLFALFAAAGYEVALADISAMPWQRQVQLAYGADIVAGAHGPALDLVLWAHPTTRVLEFFPEGTRRYDGQLLAEAAGLAYLGLEGVAERGFIIQARQRWGPPVGHADRLVWALPWTMLEQALAVPKPAG